ncbi:MAG: methylated-DNA--[protein]-cysteine S-methyltransferase [bacterium]|nr:methylated-DNA--[protein]-cysteine S-methyltransferase [bacterium]
MSTVYVHELASPLGVLTLESDGRALLRIRLPEETWCPDPRENRRPGLAPFATAVEQLRAYFGGDLRTFDLALAPRGTAFQTQVWRELLTIPYGETTTYTELARRLGRPTACRAVGAANGRNPLPIIVPCHRVIGSDSRLTGYAGGLDAKRRLLVLENALPLVA